MSGNWRAVRRRLITPSHNETKLSTRGFYEKSPEARETLETVGATFLDGYAFAVEARDQDEAHQWLERIPVRFRGFGYEGAAMGLAMLDGLPVPGNGRVKAFLTGHGAPHDYMVHVGVGWAMARLPRFRWASIAPADPLLRWLALDGYGFHQAYFHTRRYVHEHYQEPAFPWPGDESRRYAGHAVDQGIGRALWFIGGTDPAVVAELVNGFAADRRPDLYSGVGLAACYAGGADEAELLDLLRRADRYRPQLAQGAAFAATARVEAGLVIPHTELATELLCGLTPHQATEVCSQARPTLVVDDRLTAYEVWRQRISERVASDAPEARA
jgi:enediyne biosynthesis protein E3